MSAYTKPQQALALLACLGLAYLAAAIGSIATWNADNFYQQLDRPGWAPPAGLFGPVWSVLYTLIGIATWLVWRRRGWSDARVAHRLNIAQLGLNALWSWIYFAWRSGAWAFAEILLLWLLIAATLLAFWRISRVAGILMLPYLLWTSYAACLAYATWQRNTEALG